MDVVIEHSVSGTVIVFGTTLVSLCLSVINTINS